MVCYRMKHLPTGLYYRPSSDVKMTFQNQTHWFKTNLSKKGKIYPTKPSFKWIGNYYNHIQRYNDLMVEKLASESGTISLDRRDVAWKTYPFVESEWVIEEI